MKSLAWNLLPVLLWFGFAAGQPAGAASRQESPAAQGKRLKSVRLAEGVYGVFPLAGAGTSTNTGFVVTGESVWVFDAFKEELVPELLREIRAVTDLPVTRLVFSHHHHDHVEGTGLFPQAVTIGHLNMRANLRESAPENHPTEFPRVTYRDQLVFHEGGREIQILHLGRYHTNGDSLLYLPAERIVFAGDLYSADSAGNMREGYLQEWIESLEVLQGMEVEKIVPGHGDQVGRPADLAAYRAYIKAFLREVKEQIQAGRSLEEIQQNFSLPEYQHLGKWSRFIKTNLQRAYQELTGRWTVN